MDDYENKMKELQKQFDQLTPDTERKVYQGL